MELRKVIIAINMDGFKLAVFIGKKALNFRRREQFLKVLPHIFKLHQILRGLRKYKIITKINIIRKKIILPAMFNVHRGNML